MISEVEIAQVVHAINCEICKLNGEDFRSWDETDEQTKTNLINALTSEKTPKESHENWMECRLDQGWKYGPVKSIEDKISPCLVPYDELPYPQKVKDCLVVGASKWLREQQAE